MKFKFNDRVKHYRMNVHGKVINIVGPNIYTIHWDGDSRPVHGYTQEELIFRPSGIERVLDELNG